MEPACPQWQTTKVSRVMVRYRDILGEGEKGFIRRLEEFAQMVAGGGRVRKLGREFQSSDGEKLYEALFEWRTRKKSEVVDGLVRHYFGDGVVLVQYPHPYEQTMRFFYRVSGDVKGESLLLGTDDFKQELLSVSRIQFEYDGGSSGRRRSIARNPWELEQLVEMRRELVEMREAEVKVEEANVEQARAELSLRRANYDYAKSQLALRKAMYEWKESQMCLLRAKMNGVVDGQMFVGDRLSDDGFRSWTELRTVGSSFGNVAVGIGDGCDEDVNWDFWLEGSLGGGMDEL